MAPNPQNRFLLSQLRQDDEFALPLATLDRWDIPNKQRREAPPERRKAAEELWKRERPDARLRSSSAVYNCVGMVFGARRTWIDADHLATILERDGYRALGRPADCSVGDLVVYYDADGPSHVGVITAKESDLTRGETHLTVLSKWGEDGEYEHGETDVPALLGNRRAYWTERRLLK